MSTNRQPFNLPDVSQGLVFDTSKAQIDRVEVELLVALPGRHCRQQIVAAMQAIGANSDLFNPVNDTQNPTLDIRKRKVNDSKLLLQGSVRIGRGKRLIAKVSFNVQKLMANHPNWGALLARGEAGLELGALQSFFEENECRLSHPKKLTLDGNSNYMSKNKLPQAYSAPITVTLYEIVRRIHALIVYEMSRYSPEDVLIFGNEQWTIKQIEMMWEFQCNNARLFAHYFGDHLRHYFVRSSERSIACRNDEGPITYYVLHCQRGIELACYAKSPNRLRIECRYKTNAQGLVAGGRDENYGIAFGALETFGSMLAIDAADRLNIVQQAFSTFDINRLPDRHEHIVVFATISECAKGSFDVTREVITQLVTSGKISERGKTAKLVACLKGMHKKGLITRQRKPHGGNVSYIPNPPLYGFLSSLPC